MNDPSASGVPSYGEVHAPITSLTPTADGSGLRITLASGTEHELPAALVWQECPSAAGKRRRLQGAATSVPQGLRIVRVDPVGRYAVNIGFSDGHDRGIYPWPYLLALARRPTVDDFIIPAEPPLN